MWLPTTVNVQCGRHLARRLKEVIMKEVLLQMGGIDSIRAVQIGYEVICVTFSSTAAFCEAKSKEVVKLFGLWCPILGGGPPPTRVHVFDFPFEGPDAAVEVALKAFGSVKGVHKQTYIGNCSVFTGPRMVWVVIEKTPPRFLTIGDYRCLIWYMGQPLVCNLCAKPGHKSAECPNKDKCWGCGQSGHFAWQCTNAWGGVEAQGEASPIPEEVLPSLAPGSISSGSVFSSSISSFTPEEVPLLGSSSSDLSLDEEPSAGDSSSESSDSGSDLFQFIPESEHIDLVVSIAVASASEAVALGPAVDAPLEDIDDKSVVVSEANSVASTIVPQVRDDCPSVFSRSPLTNDSVGATRGPLKRKHCSSSSDDDDDPVAIKVANGPSCESTRDSVDNMGSLLDELFSGSSVVASSAPGVDRLVGVAPVPWVPPQAPILPWLALSPGSWLS